MGLSASVEGANDLCWVPPSWPKVPYLPGIFATAVSDQRGRALTCNALLGWRGHSSRASLMAATVHCGPDPVPPPQARPDSRGASCALLPCQSGNVVITSSASHVAICFVRGASAFRAASAVGQLLSVNSSEAEGNVAT